jgi:periplasmic divalent cation tolerance protein
VTGCIQVTTTLPSRDAADRLAAQMVEDRLAACVQVVGPVSSTYRWEGRVETAQEWYCHLKTTDARLPALIARVRQLHTYQVPEIVALPIVDGDPAYLRWIEESVAPTDLHPPEPGSGR